MIHADFTQYQETAGQDPFTLQNSKLLKVHLKYGPIKAQVGSMVAYQGEVQFTHAGAGGASNWLKTKVTGEGVLAMDVTGTGEVFLANTAQEVKIMYLENDAISVNGANVLAYSASLKADIRSIGAVGSFAGGLFNTYLSGTGYVAIVVDGPPVVLNVADAPTCADPQAVVMWTHDVQMNLKSDVNYKTFIGRGSGETIQMSFTGTGWVMVQPSEGVKPSGGTKGGIGL